MLEEGKYQIGRSVDEGKIKRIGKEGKMKVRVKEYRRGKEEDGNVNGEMREKRR